MSGYAAVSEAFKLAEKQTSLLREALKARETQIALSVRSPNLSAAAQTSSKKKAKN
jgi:hypothetical protein